MGGHRSDSILLDIHLLQGDDRLGAVLDAGLAKGGSDMDLDGGKGSVVLDIHLLQGDDRLGAVFDAGLAKGGSDMDLDGGKGVSRP